MSRRGRKPKIYPKEAVDAVIYNFIQENNNTGTLKYMDIFRHSRKMYENGLCEHEFSEDFWRKQGRQGREAIDQANKVYEYSPNVLEESNAINKLFDGTSNNKEKLIGALVMNENKLKKIIKKNEDLKLKLDAQNEVNNGLEQDVRALKSKLEQYEELFFQWLDASSDDRVPLLNLIRTGKTRNKVVENLFRTMFSDEPLKGFEEFEHFRQKKRESIPTTDKVVEFKAKNTLIEDLDLWQ